MSWLLLIAGIVIWSGAHLFRRVRPEQRAALGEKGKGIVAAALAVSLVLMVIGYRGTPVIWLWYPAGFLNHINNTLMLLAAFLFFVGSTNGKIATFIRHPQLTAVKTWAIAHLLVNGDLASLLLFGGLLGWAVAEVVIINRAEPVWEKPEVKKNGDLKAAVVAAVFYGIAVAVHVWLGYNVLG